MEGARTQCGDDRRRPFSALLDTVIAALGASLSQDMQCGCGGWAQNVFRCARASCDVPNEAELARIDCSFEGRDKVHMESELSAALVRSMYFLLRDDILAEVDNCSSIGACNPLPHWMFHTAPLPRPNCQPSDKLEV